MKKVLIPMLALVTAVSAELKVSSQKLTIENDFIKRRFSVDGGQFKTAEIINKLAKKKLLPTNENEFQLRLSKGAGTVDTDYFVSAKDMTFVRSSTFSGENGVKGLKIYLESKKHELEVELSYELTEKDFYLRKTLSLKTQKPFTLERVDVESLGFKDAYQPYTIKAITSKAPGNWKPSLGQPLFTKETGTFWGVEFPAAQNTVVDDQLNCGYLHGQDLNAGDTFSSYKAVVGVSDDPKFIKDAFYDYITRIRIRPLRLQTQYNSWFDYSRGVNKDKFKASVEKVNDELCVKRGVKPLAAYVIDDGWSDSKKNSDWSEKVWTINNKFDQDFATSRAAITAAKSTLGIWISPCCNFGALGVVPSLRAKGWGALTRTMSMANTTYMDKLEERMVEMTKEGVTYFKLDGIYGHLNIRDFELGGKNGVPAMPQLNTEGFRHDDKRLNNSKYDELKSYYLSVSTTRMMKMFGEMSKANPDIYIVISNAAYLSPWWLQYVDSVWMINAGDAAGGSSRTKELVYRDGVYHDLHVKENTMFPINALFNHEPKKTANNETKDQFRKYLYMNMSRGTGFVELYLKTFKLAEYDWDVLAEGLHWVRDVFPTFTRARMHGGDPKEGEVYGYTAWNKDRGYVSLHNPSDEAKTYSFKLDRAFGLVPGSKGFALTSPLADSLTGLKKKYAYGEAINLTLEPGEVRILNFDPKPKKWAVEKALQVRTKADFAGAKKISIKRHKALGKWEYEDGGDSYSLVFTKKGKCIFRQDEKTVWTKKFYLADESTLKVGNETYSLQDASTMNINGLYTAKKK